MKTETKKLYRHLVRAHQKTPHDICVHNQTFSRALKLEEQGLVKIIRYINRAKISLITPIKQDLLNSL